MELASRTSTPNDKPISSLLYLINEQWLLDLGALKSYQQRVEETSNNIIELQMVQNRGPKISLLANGPLEREVIWTKKIGFVDRFTKLVYPMNEAKVSNRKCGDTTIETINDGSCWKSVAKAKYRKQVAEPTSFLALPEVLLAAKREDEIKFERVASKATKRLTHVFLNEDKFGQLRSSEPKRMKLRDMFLDHIVEKGLKGDQVMPHEIVSTILKNRRISKGVELSLDAQ